LVHSRGGRELWRANFPESEIRFSIRHLVLSEIRGRVGRWSATWSSDADDATLGSVEVVIDAGSLETGSIERDNHTRSSSFLNIAAFPQIRFRSRTIHAVTGRRLAMAGELTIRDVTRPVTVMMERQDHAEPAARLDSARMRFKGRASIRRRDFGLRWHEEAGTGALIAGDQVDIDIALTLRRVTR
jgi:polyisoprenoid-binding protein YceI